MAGRYKETLSTAENVVTFPGASNDPVITLDSKEVRAIMLKNRPRGLKPDERKKWALVVADLIQEGRYKPIYNEHLRQYCIVSARMDRTLDYLDDEDVGWKYTTSGRNGTQHKTRPEAAQYNDDWRKWKVLNNELGLSPVMDQRFHTSQPDMFDSPFAGMK